MSGATPDGHQPYSSQLWGLAGTPAQTRAGSALPVPCSRCDLTMDAIKSYIIQHRLKPGDILPTETALCEELNASRSSVREANRKLEALHIVNVVHGKGTFVGDLSLEPLVETLAFRAMMTSDRDLTELRDVINVRRILDLGVAEQVVQALKGTDQPHLAELTEQMSRSAEHGESFLQEDIEFHTELLRSTGNTTLMQLARSLWLVHMAVLPQLGLQISTALNVTASAHRDMMEAAIRGDAEAYRKAVLDHYRPIEEILHTELD
ncbi:FadR/GntR family transcriptional regulator [uncultured Bifidobacterium sp.]|uniref:FadR/GntR family transcriptional regulator n=1 Tax=uncultured Bifidobacterium sp. TaxID=165187 RepID=UPI0025917AA1|nr:FadR/GntR family transcriptional regulator [uncultured Bifidobacterium sp.]